MKAIPAALLLFSLALSSNAFARDRVSVGVSFSSGPRWDHPYSHSHGYCGPAYYPPAPRRVYYVEEPVYYVPAPIAVFQESPSLSNTVVRVQAALRNRKYYAGQIDGIPGKDTQNAIRMYQLDRNLPVTGKIDLVLLQDLGL